METTIKRELINFIKRPRIGFSNIIGNNINKYNYLLITVLGISIFFNYGISKGIGDQFGSIGIILYIFILGPIFGFLWSFAVSLFIGLSGKWLKGKAKTMDVFNIISIAAIPLIMTLFVDILNFLMFGSIIFSKSFNSDYLNNLEYFIYIIGYVINTILEIYYAILFVIGISVIQGFSVIKSILNIFISIMLIIIFMSLIIIFIGKL